MWANEWIVDCVWQQSRTSNQRLLHILYNNNKMYMRSFGCRHPVYIRERLNDVKSGGMSLISFFAATKAHRTRDWQIRHTYWQHWTANKKEMIDLLHTSNLVVSAGSVCDAHGTQSVYYTFGLFMCLPFFLSLFHLLLCACVCVCVWFASIVNVIIAFHRALTSLRMQLLSGEKGMIDAMEFRPSHWCAHRTWHKLNTAYWVQCRD